MNNSIIDAMVRHGIGLNTRFFEQLQATNSKYPPHNITQIGDNYCLTMAVAGFTIDDLEISVQNEHLTVVGKQPKPYYDMDRKCWVERDGDNSVKILYQGIGLRDFSSSFLIGDVEVSGAILRDGLLEITLIRHIPEAKKIKRIAIGNGLPDDNRFSDGKLSS
jgi:molecular chaperone IbpA